MGAHSDSAVAKCDGWACVGRRLEGSGCRTPVLPVFHHHRGACPVPEGVQGNAPCSEQAALSSVDGQVCSEHLSIPSARGRRAQGPLPASPRLPLGLREGQRGSWLLSL